MNDYPCSPVLPPSWIIPLRKVVGVSLKAFSPSELKSYWSLSDSEMPWGTWTYNTMNLDLILAEVPAPEYTATLMFMICVKRYPGSGTRHSSAELSLAVFCLLLYSFVDSSIRWTSDHCLAVYYSFSCSLYRCLTLVALLSNSFVAGPGWRPAFFRLATISHDLEL